MDPSNRLSAIRPVNLTNGRSSTAEHLREWILSNHFSAGQRLPSERELAERLGVSRTTLREAISTLEATGLVEVRHGSGCYVTGQVSQKNLASIWQTWYASHRNDLIHLLQVRDALETKAVALASAHATPELITRLRSVVDAMQDAAEHGDLGEVAVLDNRFHTTIVEMSGNPILVQLLSSLGSALEDDRIAVLSLNQRLERSLEDHRTIIAAIEQHDTASAEHALHQHFQSVLNDVTDNSA